MLVLGFSFEFPSCALAGGINIEDVAMTKQLTIINRLKICLFIIYF